MRIFVLIAAATLAACGPQESVDQNTPAGPNSTVSQDTSDAPDRISDMEKAAYDTVIAARTQGQTRALETRARQVMEVELYDAFSARFRSLREGREGAVCGQVNARNRYGAYVGFRDFVIQRGANEAQISGSADGVRTELSTAFSSAYVAYCASREEVAAHRAVTEPPQSSSPSDEPEARFANMSQCINEATRSLPSSTDVFVLCSCAIDRHRGGVSRSDAIRHCADEQGVQLPDI